MPFVKLDCGLLDSTLWSDEDGSRIFITALLMARPRQYKAAVPQIAVREIRETGWSAPAGWYGFIAAAGVGIAQRALISDRERALTALERLGDVDDESRSKDHEGRRLIRVDGGYIVLNYDKYREHDYTAAERMRELREKKRGVTANVTAVTANIGEQTPVRPNVTQAEADTEEEVITPSSAVDSPESKHEESKALFTPPAFAAVWKDEILAVKVPKPAGKKRAETAYRQKVRTAEAYERFQHGLANYRASKRVKEGFVQDAGRWFSNFDEWADYSDQKAEKSAAATADEPPRTLRERIEFYAPNVYEFIRTRGDPDSSATALEAFEEVFQRDISAPNGDGTRWAKWKRICGEVSINPKPNSEATK